MRSALLSCESVRIDFDGAALLDGLSCSSSADRLGLVGDWSPLFRVLGSQAVVSAGRLFVHGAAAGEAVQQGSVGLAVCDPPLPPDLRAAEYLAASASLLGLGRADARRAASGVLERLGLTSLAPRKLAQLGVPERRALLLLHAMLGEPPVLALETPLAGLDDAAGAWLLELVFRAAFEKRLIVSVANAAPSGPERALLDRAAELMVLGAGSLLRQGPPAEALAPARRVLVTVLRRAPALAQRLSEDGAVVHVTQASGVLARFPREGLADLGEAARLLVELPEGGAADLVLAAALATEAPIVELVPHAS